MLRARLRSSPLLTYLLRNAAGAIAVLARAHTENREAFLRYPCACRHIHAHTCTYTCMHMRTERPSPPVRRRLPSLLLCRQEAACMHIYIHARMLVGAAPPPFYALPSRTAKHVARWRRWRRRPRRYGRLRRTPRPPPRYLPTYYLLTTYYLLLTYLTYLRLGRHQGGNCKGGSDRTALQLAHQPVG